jgi:hypothetical protein
MSGTCSAVLERPSWLTQPTCTTCWSPSVSTARSIRASTCCGRREWAATSCAVVWAATRPARSGATSTTWRDPCFDNHLLDWAGDGVVVASFAIAWPTERGGTDPHALDTLMEGLAFQLDNPDDYGIEDPVTIQVSVTSALGLAGRITGREIDATWLGAVHSNFTRSSPADTEGMVSCRRAVIRAGCRAVPGRAAPVGPRRPRSRCRSAA